MENELLKMLGSAGVLGVVVFFGGKYGFQALQKMYSDMQAQYKVQLEESNKREDKLMSYLDKKNVTDLQVAQTLETICSEMINISTRLEEVENCTKKKGDDSNAN